MVDDIDPLAALMGVLHKKTGSFLTIFRRKGGGSGLSQKNLYQKKTEVVKKRGGGLSFLTQSKKNSFFMAPQISSL